MVAGLLLLGVLPAAQAGSAIYSTPYAFTTFAGQPGVSGTNDGTGSAARFVRPNGLAMDAAGNIYVADINDETIRKVTPAGVETTIAGQPNVSGYMNGTNGGAQFYYPVAIAVDSATNLYVSEILANRVRKITPVGTNWVVSSFAGQAGESGTNDGTGTSARFGIPGAGPNGLTVDRAGNIYVVDEGNDTVRKITPAGVVTTLAGKPEVMGTNDGVGSAALFSFPTDVAVDSSTNLYVADSFNYTIRKVTPVGSNWVVTTIAGQPSVYGSADGPGNAAEFNYANYLTVDGATNLYVSDYFNSTIRKVSPVGTNWTVTTLAGLSGVGGTNDGTGSKALFNQPGGVLLDGHGYLYVADVYNYTIRKGYATVLPPLTATLIGGTNVDFQFTGSPGSNYVLQVTANLTPPIQWLPLATNTADANGNWTFTQTNVVPNPPQFFRIASP